MHETPGSPTPDTTRALLATIALCDEPMSVSDPNLPDHPVIAVNDAFTRLTGYAATETIGRNCRFLQGEGTDPRTVERISRCLADRRGCIEWIINTRRDGSVFWNLLFLSPVFDRDGTLLHFIGNQRDITQGPPADLPDYSLGRAEMPQRGLDTFNALLLDVLAGEDAASDDGSRARNLERIIAAARALNHVTIGLAPVPWSLPAPGR